MTTENSPFKQPAKPGMAGNGEDFEVPPDGSQEAVLVALIDLGTHDSTFMGEVQKPVRQVFLVWELTAAPMSGYKDRNHVIGQRYNASYTPKSNLRLMMEKWRGKPYQDKEIIDVLAALGHKCMLDVVHVMHDDGEKKGQPRYAKVAPLCATRPHPKVPVPPAKHKPFLWSMGDSLDDLPDWLPFVYGTPIKEEIQKSHEQLRKPGAPAAKTNGQARKPQPAQDEGTVGDADDGDLNRAGVPAEDPIPF